MLRITPIIKHISEEKDKQILSFYHCSKTALRIPFTFQQHQNYSNLKKSERKEDGKQNSIKRIKEFFAKESKDIETQVNDILIHYKISLENLVYNYDPYYRVMRFFAPANTIGPTLSFDKSTLENIVKANKPIKIKNETKTLAQLANSNNPSEIITFLAGLPHSKQVDDVDLFLKIMGANELRQALKNFKDTHRKEIAKHKIMLDYRVLDKNFRFGFDNLNTCLTVYDKNSASKTIASIPFTKEAYEKENAQFVMPDKLQAILLNHCGERAIQFLQSMLDYLTMHQHEAKPKGSRRGHHQAQPFKVYDPYLHFTPPDFDNIIGRYRKSPHTPPPQDEQSSDEEFAAANIAGKKRKASEENTASVNQQAKRRKNSKPNLFSQPSQSVKEEEMPEIPGNQLAAL